MKKEIKKIKTCVNCRHLEIIEEGQIVDGLGDSAYMEFRCDAFNYSGKEVFSFPPGDKRVVIEDHDDDDCPFWEEWIKNSADKEEKSGTSDEKSENEALKPDDY